MVSGQFESARVHPRRRPVINTSLAPEGESSSSKMQLKKGETFNTPTSPPSSDRDPVLNIRSLPRRSPTSLDAIAASEQRMASILERLTLDDQPEDKSSSVDALGGLRSVDAVNAESKPAVSTPSTPSSEDGYDLFPRDKQQQQKHQQLQHDQDHGHESDSGLGSSVSSRESLPDEKVNHNLHMEPSPVTTSSILQGTSARRQLSYGACKKIERFILVPILKEPKLKPFHPLVRSIPTRIVNKQIVCLRDLEKILLWLAPNFSASRSSYLGFCEFTIQCLHTSASHLNARDQRLPADRPYTNGYFLDIVTQVRRYAAMIQANRQRVQATQDAQAQSTNKDEQSSLLQSAALQGGLSKNGRPIELVLTYDDGQVISMASGLPCKENEIPPPTKRSIDLTDEHMLDEGVQRSMARRKKNAPPMDINQKCAHCDKVFKRPCDLTKHEKTHSRPWKCTETDCKYHQIGWPTEKERDRHMNDKHSDTPTIFSCTFEPCTYNSKRESNCKQHMEKAHGWIYVRSKHSSRAMGARSNRGTSMRASPAQTSSAQATPAAGPATPSVSTPASFGSTSVGPTPSPREAAIAYPDIDYNFADPPAPLGNGFPTFIETFDAVEAAGNCEHIETGVENYTGYAYSPYQASSTSGLSNDQVMMNDPVLTKFDMDELASLQAQFESADPDGLVGLGQLTNEELKGIEQMELSEEDFLAGVPYVENQYMGAPAQLPGLSPGAHGNIMLYSPDLGMSGGNISQDFPFSGDSMQQHDFTLFAEPAPAPFVASAPFVAPASVPAPGPQLQATHQRYGQGQYLSPD